MSTLTTRAEWITPNLITLLETYKITPRRSLGQAFLSDQETIDAIVSDLSSFQTDHFIEIGAGPGLLTYELARQTGRVISIEIDQRFMALHKDLFADLPIPPIMIYEDARDVNESYISDLLFGDEKERKGDKILPPYVLFGNLPYYLTTELILSSLTHFPTMQRAIFMVQADAVERLVASPGSKRYGPLAIASQLFGHWHIRRTVSRQSFYPVPRVTSKIVELIPSKDSEARQLAGDLVFHSFLVALFQSRRKTISNALTVATNESDQEEQRQRTITLFLKKYKLSSSVRAEALSPTQLGVLFQHLHAYD